MMEVTIHDVDGNDVTIRADTADELAEAIDVVHDFGQQSQVPPSPYASGQSLFTQGTANAPWTVQDMEALYGDLDDADLEEFDRPFEEMLTDMIESMGPVERPDDEDEDDDATEIGLGE